jgi:Tfp pilus assembly protein PilV
MELLSQKKQPCSQAGNASAGNECGFTVIEVVIAVAVLIIGLVSAAAMQTRALEQSTMANKLSHRVMGGEAWMEELITRPILTSGDLVRDSLFADNMSGQWQDAPQQTGATYAVQYRASTQTPLEFLTTIDVRVSKTGAFDNPDKIMTFTLLRSARWN